MIYYLNFTYKYARSQRRKIENITPVYYQISLFSPTQLTIVNHISSRQGCPATEWHPEPDCPGWHCRDL